MKFNSVTEMIKALSNLNFYFRWLRHRLDWLNVYEHEIQSEWYDEYQQQARIYLDEYQLIEPEIETDNFFYLRFLKRK